MNNLNIAALILGTSVVLAPTAVLAGGFNTGVDNTVRIERGHTWSKSNIDIDNFSKTEFQIDVEGVTTTNKFETFGPNAFVRGSVNVDGEFSASGWASTDVTNPDPVVINLSSVYTEKYSATGIEVEKASGNIQSGSNGVYTETYIDANTYGEF